jgi:ketosteroid isomerase-like protein
VSNTERFLAYLAAYARKDLAAIREMFSEDIQLRDWNIAVRGRDAAIDVTAKNFNTADTIEIDPLALYISEGAVAGELKIVVDKRIKLRVVDVISFNAQGKISAVRAYLGRDDDQC